MGHHSSLFWRKKTFRTVNDVTLKIHLHVRLKSCDFCHFAIRCDHSFSSIISCDSFFTVAVYNQGSNLINLPTRFRKKQILPHKISSPISRDNQAIYWINGKLFHPINTLAVTRNMWLIVLGEFCLFLYLVNLIYIACTLGVSSHFGC